MAYIAKLEDSFVRRNIPSALQCNIQAVQREAKRRLDIFKQAFDDGREREADSSLGHDDLAIPVITAYIDMLEVGKDQAMAWLDERLAAMVAAGECQYSVPFPGSMTVAEACDALRGLKNAGRPLILRHNALMADYAVREEARQKEDDKRIAEIKESIDRLKEIVAQDEAANNSSSGGK